MFRRLESHHWWTWELRIFFSWPWDMSNFSATSVCPLFYVRGHLLKKKKLACRCNYKHQVTFPLKCNPKITSTLPAERNDSRVTFAVASAPSTCSRCLLSPGNKTILLQCKRRLGKGDNVPNHHFSGSLKSWYRYDKQTIETPWQRSKRNLFLESHFQVYEIGWIKKKNTPCTLATPKKRPFASPSS